MVLLYTVNQQMSHRRSLVKNDKGGLDDRTVLVRGDSGIRAKWPLKGGLKNLVETMPPPFPSKLHI